jgi:hypothetical protein
MHNLNPNVDFVITEKSAVALTVQIGITKLRGTRYCDRSYVDFLSTSTHISEQHFKYVTSNPSKSFPIHYSSVILTFDSVQSLLLTPLWHKPQTNKQHQNQSYNWASTTAASTYRLYIRRPHWLTDCTVQHYIPASTTVAWLYSTALHTGQHDCSMTVQSSITYRPARQYHQQTDCIYGGHTVWLHENCSNKTILVHLIVNRTILMF